MSEQTIQNALYSNPVTMLEKYTCYSLGATTIRNLMNEGKIKKMDITNNISKKPDVLIVKNSTNAIIVYMEFKTPEELNSATKLKKAIRQEIDVAREVKAKIYIVSDGNKFYWLNPITGNPIIDEDIDGNEFEVRRSIRPKEENQIELVDYIEKVALSVNENNDKVLKIDDVDPTGLAKKINRILRRQTFASTKMALYTFVELFLFKYLSDINVLQGNCTFNYLCSLYEDSAQTKTTVLKYYLENSRQKMSELFPKGKDGTSVVNGQVFHLDEKGKAVNDEDIIFHDVIMEFKKYDRENGPFISISKDFKSKLFETFMKNSDDKSEMGQFFSPLKVVLQMIDMVNIEPGMKICDPAMGVGKFLTGCISKSDFDYCTVKNGEIKKNIELVGYEKTMSGGDDITTILAKANMLIFNSKLFRENNSETMVKKLSESILNESFTARKTLLGTLGEPEFNAYDLILANPPYYQEKTITDAAKKVSDIYSSGGLGIEALFMNWIITALKENGIANVIFPDGIFSNIANKELKQRLLDTCQILSIISLPVGTFFNTPKKTYILTFRKKTQSEIKNHSCEHYKFFSYICNSIGETLDNYRFDTPNDDDLRKAVSNYCVYRNLYDKPDMYDMVKDSFDTDKKMKVLDIDDFLPSKSWIIENWWTDDEKIAIGLKKEQKKVSLEEFNMMIDDAMNALIGYKEAVECLI